MAQLRKWRLTLGFIAALSLLLLANISIFHSFSQSKTATTWVEHTYQVLLRLEAVTAKVHEHKHSYKRGHHTDHHNEHSQHQASQASLEHPHSAHQASPVIPEHPHGEHHQVTQENQTHQEHQQPSTHQNEPLKNLVAISDDMRSKLYAEIDEIRQLTAETPEQQQRLKSLKPILVRRFAISDQLDKIRHEQGVDSPQALAIGDEVDKLNIEINQKLDDIGNTEKQLLGQRQHIAAYKESIAIISFSSAWLIALVVLGITARALRIEIKQRKRHEIALLKAKNQAEEALNLLQHTQEELVQAEKMAALGGLVAGIAHEINTPIGITLSSATYLNVETTKVAHLYQENELDGEQLENYFDTAQQSSTLMTMNCQRAAELINSFKQVAVDQTSDKKREFNLKNYLEEVLLSLRPHLKKTVVTVNLSCPADLKIKGYPGAISQIMTNFLLNSLVHAYDANQQGVISIQIALLPTNEIELIYADDGKGIAQELQAKIFEPFFTTRRGNGGSGLGLHIVYNLVRQTLKGHLQMFSTLGQGTTFTLRFPSAI